MNWRMVLPAMLAVLLGCESQPVMTVVPHGPSPGVLTVVLDFDRDAARLAGADSALVRIRNLFVAPGEFTAVKRVPLPLTGEPASVDFELPPRTGYYGAVIAYNSATGEAFAGGELDAMHAATVIPDQQRSAAVRLSAWNVRLTPPHVAMPGVTGRYGMRITDGPPPSSLVGGPPFAEIFVHSWGLLTGFEPWSAGSRPDPIRSLVLGAAGGGPQAETTYFVYFSPPEVLRDTLLYVQGFLVVGGPEWREGAGSDPRTFRVYSEGLESVHVQTN
jgi:hypothetical protein